MPWLYFDGKLFQQKYMDVQQTQMPVRYEQLCEGKVSSKAAIGHKIY
jgi:hypothetical protein